MPHTAAAAAVPHRTFSITQERSHADPGLQTKHSQTAPTLPLTIFRYHTELGFYFIIFLSRSEIFSRPPFARK